MIDFYRGILDAMAVSYSTASSNATLPVTLRCAERNLERRLAAHHQAAEHVVADVVGAERVLPARRLQRECWVDPVGVPPCQQRRR